MSLPLDVVPTILDHVFSLSDLNALCLASKNLNYYATRRLYDGTLHMSTIACEEGFPLNKAQYYEVSVYAHYPNIQLIWHPLPSMNVFSDY